MSRLFLLFICFSLSLTCFAEAESEKPASEKAVQVAATARLRYLSALERTSGRVDEPNFFVSPFSGKKVRRQDFTVLAGLDDEAMVAHIRSRGVPIVFVNTELGSQHDPEVRSKNQHVSLEDLLRFESQMKYLSLVFGKDTLPVGQYSQGTFIDSEGKDTGVAIPSGRAITLDFARKEAPTSAVLPHEYLHYLFEQDAGDPRKDGRALLETQQKVATAADAFRKNPSTALARVAMLAMLERDLCQTRIVSEMARRESDVVRIQLLTRKEFQLSEDSTTRLFHYAYSVINAAVKAERKLVRSEEEQYPLGLISTLGDEVVLKYAKYLEARSDFRESVNSIDTYLRGPEMEEVRRVIRERP